jgi:hypothetical protein
VRAAGATNPLTVAATLVRRGRLPSISSVRA